MVTLSNWFWPEEIRQNGRGMPLASTYEVAYFGQWGIQVGGPLADLTLYSGQPVGSIIEDGTLSWRTNICASGVSLFGLGGFPFRVQLPGGVAVVASTGLRPEEFRRSIPGSSSSDFLSGDMAIWLRVYVDDAISAESWQEWDDYQGFQLSAGWCGRDGEESVYAHLLPFIRSGDHSGLEGENRVFGVGASAEVSRHGLFPGPETIGITASSSYWAPGGVETFPVDFFTGHLVPLGTRLDYLPMDLSPAEQLAESPSSVFGWAYHPAAAAVGHLPWSLAPIEVDGALEWDFNTKQEGPRHLGAISMFSYSDHAVVPAVSGAISNVSSLAADNVRLNRLRVQWTVNKSVLWATFFSGTDGASNPAGQFVLETIAEGHGAWCEWSTKGFTVESQAVSYVNRDTYSLVVEGISSSASLCRHSLVDPSSATEPGGCARIAKWKLSWQTWVKGRSRRQGNADPSFNFDTPFFIRYQQNMFLSDADAASLLAGVEISPSPTSVVGSYKITAIGP